MSGTSLPQPKWRHTGLVILPDIVTPFKIYLAEKNLTQTRLFNAFIIALLRGDFGVDEIPALNNRMNLNVESTLESMLSVVFRDSQGNELRTDNPKELNISII